MHLQKVCPCLLTQLLYNRPMKTYLSLSTVSAYGVFSCLLTQLLCTGPMKTFLSRATVSTSKGSVRACRRSGYAQDLLRHTCPRPQWAHQKSLPCLPTRLLLPVPGHSEHLNRVWVLERFDARKLVTIARFHRGYSETFDCVIGNFHRIISGPQTNSKKGISSPNFKLG